ncbi:MAG: RND transporter [Sedimenticola sp.]|nr:MAG: RND transporter [Sedimenticola sp.]
MSKKISRKLLTLGTIVVIAAALTYAFWPGPLMVDSGEVKRGAMVVTINEEGRTRVHNTYVVSTPVAGRLLRVAVEPGDPVIGGESVIAQMLPVIPEVLDVRSRAQASAEVSAAEAALQLARAELARAVADKDLADADLKRTSRLALAHTVSEADLDRAVREQRAAAAALKTAEASIAMRKAELENARARLISVDGNPANGGAAEAITILAPATGRVLRIMHESESTLPAGEPVMEIGNVDEDLEVVVELLSSDAVRIAPGNRVIFDDWGGEELLNGVVERVDPWGFTKVSALGVEEQRVSTVIRFTDPPQARGKLGHGFRVEVQIVVWEDQDALVVPSSALFRDGEDWAVFVVAEGTALRRRIEIGRNNGVDAQVKQGLESGERVILYPSSALTDGAMVAQREIQ